MSRRPNSTAAGRNIRRILRQASHGRSSSRDTSGCVDTTGLIRPQADLELLEARLWYEEQQPGLGSIFFRVAEAVIERTADAPLAYPLVDGDTRRATLRRYPYSVYFKVRGDVVYIIAIMHNSRDPRRW
ncbi:MAG: type II toxin-antitoxin system RelE/ParE family toxin [Chloroflexota bacterium]